MWTLLLFCLPAWGQDLRAWQGMHDGMLIELMDGELNQAVDWYQGLLTALPENDPTREQLTYWMARAYVSAGDLTAADEALKELEKSGSPPERAARLLARIKGLALQIQALPVHHSFRSGTESWVHSWSDPDKGQIGLERPTSGGNRTLAWTTRVEEGEEDAIGVLFDGGASNPQKFRMSMRSEQLSALILPTIEDLKGNRYTLDRPVSLHRKEWVAMDFRIRDFKPVERTKQPASPEGIRSFQIRDVTAFFSSDRGPNTLFLGDVVIE